MGGVAGELAIGDDLLAAAVDGLGVAVDAPAFEHAVVGVHCLGGGGDGVVGLGVPEEEVGVLAFGDDALL